MSDTILIITSSGGGGLLQSAIAIEQEEKKKDPDVKIIKKDFLKDWGGPLGGFGVRAYNWTQRSGNVFLTNVLVACNMVAEYFFYPVAMACILSTLFKNKINRVIDNQVMNTSCIIQSIRIYNRITKKKIVLEKVLVDLPTKEYRKILKSIKSLSKINKKHIRIFTVEPLLEEEQDNKEFWQKYCKISEEQITYKKYIIRNSFKQFQHKPKCAESFDLRTVFSSDEEKKAIEKCFKRGFLAKNFKVNKNFFIFSIKPEDKVFVILLGTQPSSEAVCKYIKGFIEKVKHDSDKKCNYNLFVFADRFSLEQECMFSKICNLVSGITDYPNNLSVIPMSFQKDDVLAPLFYRGDLTITRSGGHTIMELMAVSRGCNWIHSEARASLGSKALYEDLLNGIPCWEKGNARYLHEKFKGEVVTPEILYDKLSLIFN